MGVSGLDLFNGFGWCNLHLRVLMTHDCHDLRLRLLSLVFGRHDTPFYSGFSFT